MSVMQISQPPVGKGNVLGTKYYSKWDFASALKTRKTLATVNNIISNTFLKALSSLHRI